MGDPCPGCARVLPDGWDWAENKSGYMMHRAPGFGSVQAEWRRCPGKEKPMPNNLKLVLEAIGTFGLCDPDFQDGREIGEHAAQDYHKAIPAFLSLAKENRWRLECENPRDVVCPDCDDPECSIGSVGTEPCGICGPDLFNKAVEESKL